MTPRSWKGISASVLAEAGVEQDGRLVVVPCRDPEGCELYSRVFRGDGRSFYRPAGVSLVPFGLDRLPPERSWHPRYCALLLCEGESDALAAREAFQDREDARAVEYLALGIPGAGVWRDSWRQLLDPFPLVYVLGDGDGPGRRMNRRVRAAVPWARPVWLPDGEDVRSLLQRDPEALDPLLAEADYDARLWAALILSPDLDTFERRLSEWTTSR